MRKLFLFLALVLATQLVWAQSQELTTFVLVRHAEKMKDGTKDPQLTDQGIDRANRLAELFANTSFTGIYSSPYTRTINTAKPLADQQKLDIQEYNPGSKNYVSEIFDQQIGGTVLISGHSNTIPFAVNQLIGEKSFDQLSDSEYDKIFIVTLSKIGSGTVTILTY